MFERLKRLWELSGTERHLMLDPEVMEQGTIITVPKGVKVVNVHQSAKFIPHIKIDPVKEITQENA